MGVRQFTFDPLLTDDFIRFGYDLYRGDCHWIAPFEDELRFQLSPEFFFYRSPGNSHAHFLAASGRQVVGRVSALINHELRDYDLEPVGTLGFFEAVNDYAVAEDLFDCAMRWLAENGIRRVWGPMNFDIWHGYRLMTRGFDRKPFYGEPYNKFYYQDFFERRGFTPKQQWNSVEITGPRTLERLAEPGKATADSLTRQGYRFESFNPNRFRQELIKLHLVLSQSFSSFLGYTPISSSEFERLFFPLRYASVPEFFSFAYDSAGRLCGFVGGLLDLANAVRSMRGRSNLIARCCFLYHRSLVDRAMLHLIGKTPEESGKQNGLGAALFSRTFRAFLAKGYETVLMTLMARGNSSRRFLQELADDERRQYMLYEWNR
jgi:hypothetical protein